MFLFKNLCLAAVLTLLPPAARLAAAAAAPAGSVAAWGLLALATGDACCKQGLVQD